MSQVHRYTTSHDANLKSETKRGGDAASRFDSTNLQPMITAALILFVIAALLGLALAIPIIKKRTPNRVVATLHGLIAATALILLILYTLNSPTPLLQWSIGIFIVAALGGAVLVYRDARLGKPGPVGLVVIHALAAGIALIFALLATLG